MFELLQELGKGGFATTYRARVLDPDLREEFGAEIVALKIPLNKQKERVLRRELELNAGIHLRLRGLASPHLVRYLGFVSFHDQITMVMEYVEQGSLRRLLGPTGQSTPLPVDQAAQIAAGVLEGLSVIHDEGILHRDIKPENILMRGDSPKIADLGISRLLDGDELAMSFVGTPAYIAPEILTSHGATFSADLWSVSVTLYEMLTGRWPFGASRIPLARMIDSICRDEPEPPSHYVSTIPPELDAIIARGLRKRPEERYPSAHDMRLALEAWARPHVTVRTLDLATQPLVEAPLPEASLPEALPAADSPAGPPLASTIPVSDVPGITAVRELLREEAVAESPPADADDRAAGRGGRLRWAAAAALVLVVLLGVTAYVMHQAGPPPRIETGVPKNTGPKITGPATGEGTPASQPGSVEPTGRSTVATHGTGGVGGPGHKSAGGGVAALGTKGSASGGGRATAASIIDSALETGGTTTSAGRTPEKACDEGDSRGCFELAEMYLAGRGVAQDEHRAATLYDRACQHELAVGCYKLGTLYRDDRGVSRNSTKAADLFEVGCARGVSDACVDLGLAYGAGRGVLKDEAKSVQFFQKACDDGNGAGCGRLATAWAEGHGVAKDDARATGFFQRACDLGDLPGCDWLGGRYERGIGVPRDEKRAVTLYERACSGGGVRWGCNDLGRAYQVGVGGLSVDLPRAADLYKRACDARNLISCVNLGALYVSSDAFRTDLPRALPLFQQACDGNAPRGCFMAGRVYGLGQGVSKDQERATEFYRRACDGDFALGCVALASRYRNGTPPLARDDVQAAKLYQHACDLKNAEACAALASAYQEGRGVEKNPTRAADLLRQARAISGDDGISFDDTTAWLSAADYQALWSRKRASGLLPGHVEGRLEGGREEFRATWERSPSIGCQTMSHHGLTKETYDRHNTDYLAQGYSVKSVNQFVGLAGVIKYQGVWTKGCEQ